MRRLVLVAAGTLAAGCSSVSPVDLCVAWNTGLANLAKAARDQQKCGPDHHVAWGESGSGFAAQLEKIKAACVPGDATHDAFATALAGGRVKFDPAKIRACVEKGRKVRESTLAEIARKDGLLTQLQADADCDGAMTPLLGQGDVCEQNWDRPEGTWCEAEEPASGVLKCLAPGTAGAKCGQFRQCAAKTTCSEDERSSGAGICTDRLAIGARCDAEDNVLPCVEGAICRGGTCEALPTAGQACAGGPCAAGFVCGEDGTCRVPAKEVADGAACLPGDTCGSPCSTCRPAPAGGTRTCLPRGEAGALCTDGSECRLGFRCLEDACVAQAGAGGSCGDSRGDLCGPGLVCVERSCVAPVGEGAACTSSAGCEGRLWCREGICTQLGDGSPCQASVECAADFACVRQSLDVPGACRSLPAAGQPCMGGLCAGASWCDAAGGEICRALKRFGETCAAPNECESGECYANQCTVAVEGTGCGDRRGQFDNILPFAVFGLILRRRRRDGRPAGTAS